jgi:hypothetical protein
MFLGTLDELAALSLDSKAVVHVPFAIIASGLGLWTKGSIRMGSCQGF